MSEIDTINKIKTLLRQHEKEKEHLSEATLLLTTGGSFEKKYDHHTSNFFYSTASNSSELFKEISHIYCKTICLKDALEKNDLETLSQEVSKAQQNKIVILCAHNMKEKIHYHLERSGVNHEKSIQIIHLETPFELCTPSDFIQIGQMLAS